MKNFYIAVAISISVTKLAIAAELADDELKSQSDRYLDQGYSLYLEERYEEAAQYYAASIQSWPNIQAIANLCNLYLYGQGVEQDSSRAFELCRYSAEYDNSSALVMLGEMYLGGQGVDQNTALAIEHYKRAADLGHVHGQYVFGLLTLEADPVEAKNYLQRAASAGHEAAKTKLGELDE